MPVPPYAGGAAMLNALGLDSLPGRATSCTLTYSSFPSLSPEDVLLGSARPALKA